MDIESLPAPRHGGLKLFHKHRWMTKTSVHLVVEQCTHFGWWRFLENASSLLRLRLSLSSLLQFGLEHITPRTTQSLEYSKAMLNVQTCTCVFQCSFTYQWNDFPGCRLHGPEGFSWRVCQIMIISFSQVCAWSIWEKKTLLCCHRNLIEKADILHKAPSKSPFLLI